MTTKDEALKLAIDELRRVESVMLRECGIGVVNTLVIKQLEACKSALSEEVQEPVGYITHYDGDEYHAKIEGVVKTGAKLYLHPAKPLKRLSEDEIAEVFRDRGITLTHEGVYNFTNAIMDAMEGTNK